MACEASPQQRGQTANTTTTPLPPSPNGCTRVAQHTPHALDRTAGNPAESPRQPYRSHRFLVECGLAPKPTQQTTAKEGALVVDIMENTLVQFLVAVAAQLPTIAATIFLLIVAFTRFGKDRGAPFYMIAAILMMLLLVAVPAFYSFALPALVDHLTDGIARIRVVYSLVNFLTNFCWACPWVLVTIGIMLGPKQVAGKP